ncbi:pyrroline-5-carboxylate reductase [Enterococcus florum]|uniref:Pyrroline-5-carboxylate reductase n=1 Tax=Enterococcus florum TaxID=2480627 RepID=A0A4P5PBQ6_9ENTE|nr:pyrroline-5-carboxylate reductase [Enterococcus florum]GCF95635.1 pyrroline-5-carboxylate reductase [Enterococcus florum]
MKIGVYGAGNMGSAIIEGLIRSKEVQPSDLFIKGGKSQTAENLQRKLGFTLVEQEERLAETTLILIAVHPDGVLPILDQLPEKITKEKIPIVSVAAGVDLPDMTAILGEDYPIAHCIPNTPVRVNEGVLGISYNPLITPEAKQVIDRTLAQLGTMIEIDESLLEVVSAVAGSAPAFVDIFIEALADSAVLHGVNRQLAYQIVEQMIKGTAALALQSGQHPAVLKDAVTSPGGTTIKGVAALEKNGLRYAVIEAVNETLK